MRMRDGVRQIVAGVTSAAAFLCLFFGLVLIWWVALAGALLVFGAMLLVIRQKPNFSELLVSPRTSEADIREAGRIMSRASERLAKTAPRLPDADQSIVNAISAHVESIRNQVISDPEDYRRARRFITSYLENMVETVERYADLAEKSRGRHEDRLAPLSERIRAFVPALERIDTACLENDFLALETQVEALAAQMKRG
ncbi:5-bromo-4-chloroindolyl phosphate hydrolysis family protein [Ruegeria sp. 2205SS24-7]|uniref:5-bromo-4-chloroindolyl phosphate hydrolysis family protein n=1 Tax=Ruegeria discodermiae TaxID=3064389 RepID=UPI00274239C3|nr:5-bromo-4-chloroindolyl phosphate hydrolysis family protein [Ruegeria sp. 2205SS24-7]MDP5219028.1 5-bromo-4-chloroindolyl phosphate hydrolysis family protein [Ruegeria sp. 2205SS24-7]